MNNEVQRYLNMVESQYSDKPVFMGVLTKYLEGVDKGRIAAEDIVERFNLALAVGKQLDIIGSLVGVTRDYPYIGDLPDMPKTMDDETYRMVISAKIMQNSWDGTYGSFQNKWNSIFGGLGISATYFDNQDMSCSVTVSGNFTAAQAALISNGYIFPKTMGVLINYQQDPYMSDTGSANIGACFFSTSSTITIVAEPMEV